MSDRGGQPRKFGEIARGLVLSKIASAPDDETRKRYLTIAYEEGIIAPQELEDWLRIMELRAA